MKPFLSSRTDSSLSTLDGLALELAFVELLAALCEIIFAALRAGSTEFITCLPC
jgi:hypothetical protein